MRTLAPALLIAALLPACAHRAPAPGMPPPGTAHAPADLDRLFAARMNAGDLDGLVALYEGGATLVRADGTPAVGRTAIRAELAGILAAKPTLVMDVKTIRQGGMNVAVLYNHWRGTVTAGDGTRQAIHGCAIEVVRRQPDGRWLFVVDDPDGGGCGQRPATGSP